MMQQVLDKGYVRLVDHMGSDLTVVNAARCPTRKNRRNYMKRYQTDQVSSPGRAYVSIPACHHAIRDLCASYGRPPMVEICCRICSYGGHWGQPGRLERVKPKIHHRGTDILYPRRRRMEKPACKFETGQRRTNIVGARAKYTDELMNYIEQGIAKYEQALQDGICAEQARLFLPAYGMYVRWYWTASLQSVCHF